MRKIILLSLVCLSTNIFAQKSFFGIDAGINVANQRQVVTYIPINQQSVYFFQNAIKPSFGVFFQHNASDLFFLRAGARYMGMGYTDKDPANNLDINYLTLPLSLHYNANKHLSLSAGSYVCFKLGGTKSANVDVANYHANDFGFSFGVEHDVYKNFSLSALYFVGLKNIWLNDVAPGMTLKYTNRALQISLIYKFKKKS